MNNLARLVGRLTLSSSHKLITSPHSSIFTRGFTSLMSPGRTQTQVSSILVVKSMDIQPARGYKVKGKLKRRCAGCYFERRFGRLYVECKLKPRHKQMQLVMGQGFYRDDYSKGRWWKAVHWGYKNHGRFHKLGEKSEFSKFDWLEGRLGTEI